MKYGYFNCFITKIHEDVAAQVEELRTYAEELRVDTLASRPHLKEITDKLQPGDTLYIHSFARFCSGLSDLVNLLEIIIDDRKAQLISLHDDFDSSTEKGKIAKEVYTRAVPLTNADPNYGFYM